MTKAPGEAVLELVEIHRQEAAVVKKYDPRVAGIIENIANDYERAVNQHEPEWWTIREVQRRTGWSSRKLREIAGTLEADGLARRTPFWQIRRDAVEQIGMKPGFRDQPPKDADIYELARHLGRQRGAA